MQLLSVAITTLVIATLYYIWRAHQKVKTHREQQLRERVAYMLWKAAERESRTRLPIVAVGRE